MKEQILRTPASNGDHDRPPSSAPKLVPNEDMSVYISNLNKLRDIYIDSSLFRNTAWEVFLSLYTKRQDHLQVTLATLSAGNRLSEADCAEAVESLANAGLVRVNDNPLGRGPQIIDITDQARQRMAAFLGSAERSARA